VYQTPALHPQAGEFVTPEESEPATQHYEQHEGGQIVQDTVEAANDDEQVG
jgi:hypothetical protein